MECPRYPLLENISWKQSWHFKWSYLKKPSGLFPNGKIRILLSHWPFLPDTHTCYKFLCNFAQVRSKAAKFQPATPIKIKLSIPKALRQQHKEKDKPLECFPEGLLGSDSSMECVDVWSTFSKLLLTLLMGVSDLGVTWKEKHKNPLK